MAEVPKAQNGKVFGIFNPPAFLACATQMAKRPPGWPARNMGERDHARNTAFQLLTYQMNRRKKSLRTSTVKI
jgi:hypothetical protein